MTQAFQSIVSSVQESFPEGVRGSVEGFHEMTMVIEADALHDVCLLLRDHHGFDQLIDLFGVDFLSHGVAEWQTTSASSHGFSRAVESKTSGRFKFDSGGDNAESVPDRYAVEYLLLSLANNLRLRVRSYCPETGMPRVSSVVDIWNSANWYEREAFDLFGILFEGHPDLRRILTDYGFIGHPFRKDFPQIGNVEMRYDPETRRVIYQPVTIEPRVLVPKVNRSRATGRSVPTGEDDA